MKTDYFDKAAQQFANLMSDINDREDPASRGQLEKPLNFDPFGHARFAHLFVLYDWPFKVLVLGGNIILPF